MTTQEVLALVGVANHVLTLLNQWNVSVERFNQQLAKAQAEGRPFGVQDARELGIEAGAALDELDRALGLK